MDSGTNLPLDVVRTVIMTTIILASPSSCIAIADINIDQFSKESELCTPHGEASSINLPHINNIMEVTIEGPGSDIPQEQGPTPNVETTRAPSDGIIEVTAYIVL